MEDIREVTVEECSESKFVQPFRVNYRQNGHLKTWDCTKVHDSVGVLIFNTTRKEFVLVRQFRPAVYMARHRHLWQDSKIFTTSLSQKMGSHLSPKSAPTESVSPEATLVEHYDEGPPSKKTTPQTYGPGSLGCTYELCAGIIDKKVSKKQTAVEEVIEETGYKVPLESMELITSYYSSMGHSGSVQTLYYCEVTDDMKVSEGGGIESDGETIEVVHLPLEDSVDLALKEDAVPRSTGLCFAILWFHLYKRPSFII